MGGSGRCHTICWCWKRRPSLTLSHEHSAVSKRPQSRQAETSGCDSLVPVPLFVSDDDFEIPSGAYHFYLFATGPVQPASSPKKNLSRYVCHFDIYGDIIPIPLHFQIQPHLPVRLLNASQYMSHPASFLSRLYIGDRAAVWGSL